MLHLIGLALAIGFGIWFGLAAFARGEERRADRLERRAVKARQRAVWEAQQQAQWEAADRARLQQAAEAEVETEPTWPIWLSVGTAVAIIVIINIAHSHL